MHKPNKACLLYKQGRFNAYGQLILNDPIKVKCSVVKLRTASEKSAVRADSSGSRGAANEGSADCLVLMIDNRVELDDAVEVNKIRFRVTDIQPMFDVHGKFDHFEVRGNSTL